MNERKIWVRGLTPSDRGKLITIDGHDFLLRHAEHTGDKTILSVVTSIELDHRTEVEVHD
jgi:hypothetical protein